MRRVLPVIALLACAAALWSWWPAPLVQPIVPAAPRASAAEPPPVIEAAALHADAVTADAPAARDDATPPTPVGEYAARVHGRVLLADGTPAAGATVLAGPNTTTAGADGAYSLPLAMSFHALRAWLVGYEPVDIPRVGKLRAVAADRALDIVLPARASTIDGVVVGADGAPLAGWHAALHGTIDVGDASRAKLSAEDFAAGAVAAANGTGEPQVDPNHVVLPADGAFRFGGLRHDRSYGLVVWNDATVQAAWTDNVPAGTTGHRFVAGEFPSRRVESRVVDRKGAPIAGVRARLFVMVRNDHDFRVAAETRTDSDGRFVFERTRGFDWYMVFDEAGVVPQQENELFDTPILLAGQRRFRFDADPYATAPTTLRALDEKGRGLLLVRERRDGHREQGQRLSWPGDDPWGEITVSDEAAWLVLEAAGRELRRLPLRLDRDRTTIVRG